MENGCVVHSKCFSGFQVRRVQLSGKSPANLVLVKANHVALNTIKLINGQNYKLSYPLTNSALLARGSRDHHDNMQSDLADTSCLAQADDDKWNSMTLRDSYGG